MVVCLGMLLIWRKADEFNSAEVMASLCGLAGGFIFVALFPRIYRSHIRPNLACLK